MAGQYGSTKEATALAVTLASIARSCIVHYSPPKELERVVGGRVLQWLPHPSKEFSGKFAQRSLDVLSDWAPGPPPMKISEIFRHCGANYRADKLMWQLQTRLSQYSLEDTSPVCKFQMDVFPRSSLGRCPSAPEVFPRSSLGRCPSAPGVLPRSSLGRCPSAP